MHRPLSAALLALSAATALTLPALTGLPTADAARGRPPATGTHVKTEAAHWTKVSTGSVGITDRAGVARTADGLLHIIYPQETADAGSMLGHTALHTNGSIARQNEILSSGWSSMDATPAVLPTGNTLRVVFGGIQTLDPGYWSDGRMYDATSADDGATWALPAEAVGISHSAYDSYGTSATTLADGTPIAAYPLNTDLLWHVGTSETTPDQEYTAPACCLYDTAMVRDGDAVWLAWYANGSSSATNGVFAMQIYPTVGSPLKAPGSSKGVDSLQLGRVALAARAGGGVYAAYCTDYPFCGKVRLWHVGTSQTGSVAHTHDIGKLALSAGPSGRLWVAWSDDDTHRVYAARTGTNGLKVGSAVTAGVPKGTEAIYDLVVEGSRGRGDLVVNDGHGFWHAQVLAGLTLTASPHHWPSGSKQKVHFNVTDAGTKVKGAKVKAGKSLTCTTKASGACAITFPKGYHHGKHVVTATKHGYTAATVGLKVG